jgi:hypothetical protein
MVGSVKKPNTRDVLSYTSIYFSGKKDVDDGVDGPWGYYVVLWDDGRVDKIPYDLVTYSLEQLGLSVSFPRSAGIPNNSLTYAEQLTAQGKFGLFPFIGKPSVTGGNNVVVDNGGPESLIQLSRQVNHPNIYGIEREQLWRTFDPAQPEFTLKQMQTGAAKLGFSVQVHRLNLNALEQKKHPALLFLPDDGRIVTLTALDSDGAVIVDRGRTFIIERTKLQERLGSGQVEVLFPQVAVDQPSSVRVDDAVRSIRLPSLDAEVPQQFTIRNTGTQPITLQLEYPLLGVTESKLSKDVLAPGETATLDLKVKWRSILKAPTQNVLVSLQTSDPIVPRLQLAILLVPPQATNTT